MLLFGGVEESGKVFFSVDFSFFCSIILPYGNRFLSEVYPKLYPRRCSQEISDIKKNRLTFRLSGFLLARQEGFEPPTLWFVARYSIQLSYWRLRSLEHSYIIASFIRFVKGFSKKIQFFLKNVANRAAKPFSSLSGTYQRHAHIIGRTIFQRAPGYAAADFDIAGRNSQ